MDEDFIKVIKASNADYVIWWGYYKTLYLNGRQIKMPRACIYDVKNLNQKNTKYDHSLMFKISKEER
ncbi:MAG: hypothetical protein MJ225_04640 [Bacilli bacterium]|nr:hypothetical protein [Bacilli bacterium]